MEESISFFQWKGNRSLIYEFLKDNSIPIVRQISNRNTEVEFLSVDLLSSQVHAVSVILPAIESESELDVPQLAEAEGIESTSSRDCRHRILLDMDDARDIE